MNERKWYLIFCLFVVFCSCFVFAAETDTRQKNAEVLEQLFYQTAPVVTETDDEYQARMKWWMDARFGLFICSGPVSLTGEELSWSRKINRRDGSGKGGTIPPEIYDNLYKHYNPSLFDAKEWIQVAKEAGTKYIIFLTKHCDGFCLWDTKTIDYKITSPLSPFGRDICAEIAEACHKAEIKLIWYFSLGDWYDSTSDSDFMQANCRWAGSLTPAIPFYEPQRQFRALLCLKKPPCRRLGNSLDSEVDLSNSR